MCSIVLFYKNWNILECQNLVQIYLDKDPLNMIKYKCTFGLLVDSMPSTLKEESINVSFGDL